MKILVSLNNGPNRGSPNVMGQASSLVRWTLAAPINEAKASISQSVGVAARRLKRWAEEQIEKNPLGSGPFFHWKLQGLYGSSRSRSQATGIRLRVC